MIYSRLNVQNSNLPGSCIFVSTSLQAEHPDICKSIEASCLYLNITFCFIMCKYQHIVVVSVYRSPPTNPKAAIEELHSVLP